MERRQKEAGKIIRKKKQDIKGKKKKNCLQYKKILWGWQI